MSNHSSKRLLRAVLLAGFMLPAAALFAAQPSYAEPAAPADSAAQSAPAQEAPVGANDQETIQNFKQVLAQYGNFIQLDGFGEVWVPTVTPEGWHPYPPCHWIYIADIGWYFRDDTPWGAIVHHYGRWSHDSKIGWFWMPDADWSPGWVVWRDSDQWIGWAPMPPDQAAQKVSLDDFNRDKMWIFMETPQFTKGCGGTVVASNVYDLTAPVSIFELPVGLIVDVHIVPHWKIKVIKQIIVVDRKCPRRPQRPPTLTREPPPNDGPRLMHRTLYDSLQQSAPPRIRIDRTPGRPGHHTERHRDRHHVVQQSGPRTVGHGSRKMLQLQRHGGRKNTLSRHTQSKRLRRYSSSGQVNGLR